MFGFKKFLAGIAFCAACALTPSFASEAPVADATDAVYSIAVEALGDTNTTVVNLIGNGTEHVFNVLNNKVLVDGLTQLSATTSSLSQSAYEIILAVLGAISAVENLTFLKLG
ncbi:MAG: hypothetical protein LBF84_02580 [Holosporales bacterium]|jgi:hypothetical protein|nr:hypothetical protein [Holosporales bacterium]